jgi:hypothetical protein
MSTGLTARPVPRVAIGDRALWSFVARRVGHAVLVLFCVATVSFFLVRLAGDPVRQMLPPDATVAQEKALRTALGLDRSMVGQYVSYMTGLLHLDLGQSLFFHRPALDVIAERLPATLQLSAGALVVALVVAIPAGIVSALRRGTASDTSVMAVVLVGQPQPRRQGRARRAGPGRGRRRLRAVDRAPRPERPAPGPQAASAVLGSGARARIPARHRQARPRRTEPDRVRHPDLAAGRHRRHPAVRRRRLGHRHPQRLLPGLARAAWPTSMSHTTCR